MSGRPFPPPERRGDYEPSAPVVEMDDLRVGLVVADHDVEVTISVQVDEHARVRAIGRASEGIRRLKPTAPITQKDEVFERPVSSFHQHDVLVSIPVHIAHADVGRGRSGILERDLPIEAPRTQLRTACRSAAT